MFGSDSTKPASPADEGNQDEGNEGNGTSSQTAENIGGSEVAELAAKFVAHAGGRMSPELSTDLALDVVLNEIVEQACTATSATGAAIILERDGEMVCRASSGVNAPELGVRLGSEPGLTAECIKTRQVQRCDDAQSDPRADIEASRSLGVRSVMIFPLLQNDVLAGVLEVFSSQPAAFGERDRLALEALGRRILKNVEWGSKPLATTEQNPAPSVPIPISMTLPAELEDLPPSSATLSAEEEDEASPEARPPRTRLDVVTFALGVTVAACVVLFGSLVALRLGWLGSKSRQVTNSVSNHAPIARNEAAASAPASPTPSGPGNSKASTARSTSSAGSKDSAPPAGSLLVYENGKEIFRMTPIAEQGKPTSATSADGGMQRASEVEPAGRLPADVLEVSPAVAEDSVLHRVEPEYPEEARQQQLQGSVVLEVRTRLDGSIGEVKLVSGQRLLADAAITAVKQWQFRPRRVQGQPVEMHTTITLYFSLPR
jgi:TonB family protein